MAGHPWLDNPSLAYAKIDVDPTVINVAHENLERWRRQHGSLARAHLEWLEILKRPWADVRAILLDESDEGQRLRSSSPFVGIVTQEERLQIINRYPGPWCTQPLDLETLKALEARAMGVGPPQQRECASPGPVHDDEWGLPESAEASERTLGIVSQPTEVSGSSPPSSNNARRTLNDRQRRRRAECSRLRGLIASHALS